MKLLFESTCELTMSVRRFETILIGVVHPLLSFLNWFIQLLSDGRREVEVLVLNPLVLVFPNGDCLPLHCNARYTRYTYNSYGGYGSVSLQQDSIWKTMTALYPRPTALLGLRPALLVEDGGLAPVFS